MIKAYQYQKNIYQNNLLKILKQSYLQNKY